VERISLLDAVKDSHLLGSFDPWPAQVQEYEAVDDPAYALHIRADGRGSAKTTDCAVTAIHAACLRPDLDGVLARGRCRYVLVAGPGESQAREFVRVAAALLEPSPILRELATVQASEIRFKLTSGAETCVQALPCNSATTRGKSASHVICDEFAWFGETDGASSAKAMLDALDGSTVPFGDRATTLLISTPNGTSNLFAQMFRDAQAGVLRRARAVQRPTWQVRPDISAEWLDRKRVELGETSFLQEYGAEFTEAGGAFFSFDGVEFADAPAAPEDGHNWVAGLDPAFHADKFGVALVGESVHIPGLLVVGTVAGIEPGAKRRSLDLRRAREDKTLSEVARLIEPYHPTRIVTDQHQSDSIRSFFGRLGYAVKVVNQTGPSQTAAFTSTRTRLLDGSLVLWKHPGLLEELRRVRARGDHVYLPRFAGSHCDLSASLSAAVFDQRSVDGAPEGRASGGPYGVTIMSGAGSPEGVSAGELRALERAHPNLRGRTGADPDRPGAVFGGRGGGVFNPGQQW
jgi:hypothetical protein